MNLDVNTLFLVTIYVEAILGLLLLFVWLQNTAVTAVAWWGFALLLLMIADGAITPREVASVVVDLAALSGVVALVWSRGRHLSWVAFFAIAGLVYAAFAAGA